MSDPTHKSVAIVERGETAIAAPSPLAMLASAVERGMDPETIRQLMDLADRHSASEARKAYASALTNLKRDLPTVLARDKTVAFGSTRYTHTSLAAVMDAITEPLTLHGFSLAWRPSTAGSEVTVTCRLTHCAGHYEETTISAPRDDKGSKSPAQGIASTITLLSRYSALSLLGIATADMPEPRGEDGPSEIDSARNLRAMRACVEAGHTREEVEARAGKPVAEWTAVELGVLREWLKAEGGKK